MELTYKNYRAVSEGDRFNLYRMVEVTAKKDTINYKKGEVYDQEVLLGYGYTYEGLCRRIATEELSLRNEVLPLRDYVGEFRGVLETITLK